MRGGVWKSSGETQVIYGLQSKASQSDSPLRPSGTYAPPRRRGAGGNVTVGCPLWFERTRRAADLEWCFGACGGGVSAHLIAALADLHHQQHAARPPSAPRPLRFQTESGLQVLMGGVGHRHRQFGTGTGTGTLINPKPETLNPG
jgi:hypothetical protein